MPHELTHASFFSGVGGLDLGLERAGWRTVSFSEIDPYASAVLAERWLGVPNLGDITQLADGLHRSSSERTGIRPEGHSTNPRPWELIPESANATLWSGGFPCQDLSVAGKRAGFAGARSSLAFSFLDLVERHRPPAILLENVPGLLSSNAGRDFGRLLREMGELGYWWAYRILDARHFGVPQRRRRVFIVGLHAGTGLGADSAAAVLSVGTRCPRHPATGHATGEGVADSPVPGVDIARAVTGTSGKRHDDDTDTLISSSPDPGGVRAADGLAGRSHHRSRLEGAEVDAYPSVFVKAARAQTNQDDESWREGSVMPTLNAFDIGDTRTTAAIVGQGSNGPKGAATTCPDSRLLPLGLDSHRYRCCGNGVVSDVSEWIGWRLAAVMA